MARKSATEVNVKARARIAGCLHDIGQKEWGKNFEAGFGGSSFRDSILIKAEEFVNS